MTNAILSLFWANKAPKRRASLFVLKESRFMLIFMLFIEFYITSKSPKTHVFWSAVNFFKKLKNSKSLKFFESWIKTLDKKKDFTLPKLTIHKVSTILRAYRIQWIAMDVLIYDSNKNILVILHTNVIWWRELKPRSWLYTESIFIKRNKFSLCQNWKFSGFQIKEFSMALNTIQIDHYIHSIITNYIL